MKKVKDILTMSDGLFKTFSECYPDEYTSLFDDLDSEVLDIDFYNICSERYASNYLTNCSLQQIVKMLINRYYTNWLKIKELLLEDYDPLNPYFRETVTDQATTSTGTSGNVQTVDNDIYAFNSVSASPKDTSKIDTSGNNDGAGTLNSTVTVKGNNGNFTQSDLINKEIEARRLSLVQIIMNDAEQMITLSIY